MTTNTASVERPKVLVVDDEPENVRLLQRALRRQYDVLSSTSGKEALEHLQKHPDIALILTDQRMPGITGVDILRESLNFCPNAVRVVLTGYTELQDVLDAINLGQVNRFVLKPLDPDKLVNLIKDSLEVYFLARERNFLLQELERRNLRLTEHEKELERLISERTAELQIRNVELRTSNDELQRANERLSELALRDGLTGLYNHRYFQERVQSELARSRRHNHPVSLLFIDIDHFKSFNDRHGHQAGDHLLKNLALLLLRGSRMTDVVARVKTADVVARYGGEEFAVILPETDLVGAEAQAEDIRLGIASHNFAPDPGAQWKVTVSIGISCFPAEAVDAPTFIRRADKALYKAKEMGRNRVCAMEGPAEV